VKSSVARFVAIVTAFTSPAFTALIASLIATVGIAGVCARYAYSSPRPKTTRSSVRTAFRRTLTEVAGAATSRCRLSRKSAQGHGRPEIWRKHERSAPGSDPSLFVARSRTCQA
jgi:hypothetical protein